MTETADTSKEKPNIQRGNWVNETEFRLSVIGLTVGLGSVWRFPTLAYDNGGSAFLFPYLVCAVFVGFPMMYLEMVVGQYTNTGPSMIFRHYIPALQGIGWTMAITSSTIIIYYCVVVGWSGYYFFLYITEFHKNLVNCNNEWNDIYCFDELNVEKCRSINASYPIYFNGTCISDTSDVIKRMMSPLNQYFVNVCTKRSSGIEEIGAMNWITLTSIVVLYITNVVILMEGFKYLGKMGYVTSIAPYIIITILFVRAVTLEGASFGISHFLGKPDLVKMFGRETWITALVQICYTMEVGYGGILTLASYNCKTNNCYKSAWIVVMGNVFMSMMAGVTVFATLGYLSQQLRKPIDNVVSSGLPLVFVAYPEAMSKMPYPTIWGALFFAMLFFLGLSSLAGLCECLFTCIYDQFPNTRKFKWFIVIFSCIAMITFSIPFATESGFYWFTIYDEFCGTASACFVITLELILFIYIYGYRHIYDDLTEMFGEPRQDWMRIFGPHSVLWMISWRCVTPIIAGSVFLLTFVRGPLEVKTGAEVYKFPGWSTAIGWFLGLGPIAAIPIIFVRNIFEFRGKQRPLVELLTIQPSLPSYNRIMGINDQTGNKELATSGDSQSVDESTRFTRSDDESVSTSTQRNSS